jgi:hypothetical protein
MEPLLGRGKNIIGNNIHLHGLHDGMTTLHHLTHVINQGCGSGLI